MSSTLNRAGVLSRPSQWAETATPGGVAASLMVNPAVELEAQEARAVRVGVYAEMFAPARDDG